jgi:hypothetical protein
VSSIICDVSGIIRFLKKRSKKPQFCVFAFSELPVSNECIVTSPGKYLLKISPIKNPFAKSLMSNKQNTEIIKFHELCSADLLGFFTG